MEWVLVVLVVDVLAGRCLWEAYPSLEKPVPVLCIVVVVVVAVVVVVDVGLGLLCRQ